MLFKFYIELQYSTRYTFPLYVNYSNFCCWSSSNKNDKPAKRCKMQYSFGTHKHLTKRVVVKKHKIAINIWCHIIILHCTSRIFCCDVSGRLVLFAFNKLNRIESTAEKWHFKTSIFIVMISRMRYLLHFLFFRQSLRHLLLASNKYVQLSAQSM